MPFAGGSKDAFAGITEGLAAIGVEICTMEYAGHNTRRNEPFYSDLQAVARDAAVFISANRKPEYDFALFGYSMGSVVVYELMAQKLLTETPKHIFLAAHEAPGTDWSAKTCFKMDDADFLKTLRNMGGFERVDEKVFTNKIFQALYIRPIREDYKLLAQYQMSAKVVMPCPATVFYAEEDIPGVKMREWTPFLMKGSEFVAMGDNHFLIRQCPEQMVEIMKGKL